MTDQLKPFPFCGTKPKIISIFGMKFFVTCLYCYTATSSTFNTKEDAVEKWNGEVNNCDRVKPNT